MSSKLNRYTPITDDGQNSNDSDHTPVLVNFS